jgi:hypothetical protein
MALRIVTYDLIKEKSKEGYEGIWKVIKAGGDNTWKRLSESSYAMDTAQTPMQIYEKLKPYLDTNDNLYVLTLSSPWYGQHSKETNDWMLARLPLN